MLDRLRTFVGGHGWTRVLGALVLGLVVAGGVGAALVASESNKVSDLEADLDELASHLDQAEAGQERAEEVADAITGRKDEIIQRARDRASALVGDAERELDALNEQLEAAEGDLSSTQARLDEVEASLSQAQETQQKSTFSDGTWSVGEDILAGTYRSSAGGGCYWEILKSPSGGGIDNIVDNGFGPNATITVSTGQWLRVSRCGTWNPGP